MQRAMYQEVTNRVLVVFDSRLAFGTVALDQLSELLLNTDLS